MILIASLRTALDSALNPNLHQLSALQAPSFTFASISPLQNPTLQPVRTKLRYGMHVSATSQPPVFLILPKLQSYQKASKQLYLAPFQIPASASLVLKGSRHDYHIPHPKTVLHFRWKSSTLTPAMFLFPLSRDTTISLLLRTKS